MRSCWPGIERRRAHLSRWVDHCATGGGAAAQANAGSTDDQSAPRENRRVIGCSTFRRADTKTRRAMEFPIPDDLSEPIDLYLTRSAARSRVQRTTMDFGRRQGADPWVADQSMTRFVVELQKHWASPVNLHRFRRAAGNLWSISDPANVRGVKDLLGHTDFGTTEKHYIGAQSRLAGRALAKVLRSSRH